MRNSSGVIQGSIQFNTAVFGGGGFCTGLSIALDGTKLMRTDVFNVWSKGPTDTKWRPEFTAQSMPVGDYHDSAGWVPPPSNIRDSASMGGFAAAISPSNSAYRYATCNCRLYSTTNGGATYVRTAVPQIDMRPNSGAQPHNLGPNIAVDPNNPLVFLFGTSVNGLYASTDGGTTVTNIDIGANVVVGSTTYPHKVACDPTSTQSGGIRQRWIAFTQGVGPLMSTTGPAGAYTAMSGSVKPVRCMDMEFGPDGALWLTDPTPHLTFTNGGPYQIQVGDTVTGQTSAATATVLAVVVTSGSWATSDAAGYLAVNAISKTFVANDLLNVGANTGIAKATGKAVTSDNLWKWTSAGGWVNIVTGSSYYTSVAVDPANGNNVYLCTSDGYYNYSRDGGATWHGMVFSANINRYATTIAWLGAGKNATFQPGKLKFDPSQSNVLYASCGVGCFHCTPPTGTGPFNWFEEIAGQEELVANRVITPPGYPALGLSWDRAVVQWPDPTNPAPGYVTPSEGRAAGVYHGWDGDWAADNPANVYVLCNAVGSIPGTSHHGHGYSTDGGYTWGPYPTEPINSQEGGCMAVGQTGQVLHVYSNNGRPVYTTDGGNTWHYVAFAGLPTTGELGFGFAYSDNRKIATYDKVGGAFYLRNYGPGQAPSIRGIWRSTDLVNWTQVFSGYVGGTDTATAKLGAVPYNADHLFCTPGKPSLGAFNNFMRCTSASTNPQPWVPAAPAGHTIQNVVSFGFGKPVPGQTYPSVWFYGLYDGENGLWASFDNFATVQLISYFPNNSIDLVTCVTGDLNKAYRVWVGFNGSAFAYGDYNCPVAVTA